MTSFRAGLHRARSAALAVGAALAVAAIPMTSALADEGPAGPGRPAPKPAPKHAPTPAPATAVIFVSNGAACQAAMTALQQYIAGDQSEDHLERMAPRLDEDDPTEETAAATDQSEDQAENAQLAQFRATANQDCQPQPVQVSAACAAAQTALNNYNTADRAEDQLEATANRADRDDDAQARALEQTEDQAERVQEQGYQTAVHTNCEPQPQQPSAACTTSRNALNAFNLQDRREDKGEQPAPGVDPDDAQAQSGDQSEDQTENAHQHQLQQAVEQACGPAHPDRP